MRQAPPKTAGERWATTAFSTGEARGGNQERRAASDCERRASRKSPLWASAPAKQNARAGRRPRETVSSPAPRSIAPARSLPAAAGTPCSRRCSYLNAHNRRARSRKGSRDQGESLQGAHSKAPAALRHRRKHAPRTPPAVRGQATKPLTATRCVGTSATPERLYHVQTHLVGIRCEVGAGSRHVSKAGWLRQAMSAHTSQHGLNRALQRDAMPNRDEQRCLTTLCA
jgi:hypothetical protein